MAFKLRVTEEIDVGVRRMALEQIRMARRELNQTERQDKGVHEVRKCFKRLRSLIILIRPALRPKFFKSQKKQIRQMAQQIAAPREWQAQIELVEKLQNIEQQNPQLRQSPKTATNFKTKAQKRQTRADLKFQMLLQILHDQFNQELEREKQSLEIIALDQITETLNELEQKWKKINLDKLDLPCLAHGFANTYGDGREMLQVLMRSKFNSDNLHDWRKRVQQHWRQMQVLLLIWPDHMMPRIHLAREISQLIGTEHDIAVLQSYIRKHKKTLSTRLVEHNIKQPGTMLKNFHKHCNRLRKSLTNHSLARGMRLYAFERRDLEHSFTTIWQSKEALLPLPVIAQDLPSTDLTRSDKAKTPKSVSIDNHLRSKQPSEN